MSIPTLERRPTHKAIPLLRSEISRITHRRLFRALAVILLGGIAIVSVIALLAYSGEQGWSEDRILQEQATAQGFWDECAAGLPDGSDPERRCGPAPTEQRLNNFNYGGDDRYHAYELLPIVLLGVSIAAAGVAFLMGASAGGAEWSSRSMTLQLLYEPRRLRLLVCKWLGLCTTMVALTIAAMLMAVGLGAATASMRGTWDDRYGDLDIIEDHFTQTLILMGLRGLALVVIAATIGYAIAMLVRNTGASLGVAFVYFVVVENVVRFALLKYGAQPYLFAENSVGLIVPGGVPVIERIQEGQRFYEEEVTMQLTNLRAIVTLTAYTALLSIAGAWSFTRRDVG